MVLPPQDTEIVVAVCRAVDDKDQLQVRAHLDSRYDHHLACMEITHAADHPYPERTVDTGELPMAVDDKQTVGGAIAVDLVNQPITAQGLYSL